MTRSLTALAIATGHVGAAHAAEPPPFRDAPSPSARLKLDTDACASTPDEVVVCAQRGPSYRIDQALLAEMRAKESMQGKRQPGYVAVTDQSCVPYGERGCPGRDVIPVLAIALTAAKMARLAIEGEDWREPLRTRPDDYKVYLEEKAKSRTATPRTSVQVASGPARYRPGQ